MEPYVQRVEGEKDINYYVQFGVPTTTSDSNLNPNIDRSNNNEEGESILKLNLFLLDQMRTTGSVHSFVAKIRENKDCSTRMLLNIIQHASNTILRLGESQLTDYGKHSLGLYIEKKFKHLKKPVIGKTDEEILKIVNEHFDRLYSVLTKVIESGDKKFVVID